MSTIASYSTPKHAWVFLTYLHRLTLLPEGEPLLFEAVKRTPATMRVYLFQARKYIEDANDPSFEPYKVLSLSTRIKVAGPTTIGLYPTDTFSSAINAMKTPPFFWLLNEIHPFLTTTATTLYKAGLSLSRPQQEGLQIYLAQFPAVKMKIITDNSILLRK